ncbi:MAG TPA: FAD-dependent oxidoreductase [Methylophilaceae bacterium]|nr:FAD-dependent oxidoreductase [Methylophilaceae bacterium]
MSQQADIVIVGGGPVGTTLALALQSSGSAVTMLEAREQGASHQDQRALALSYGTRMILERLGIWSELEPKATAINTIHISQRGSFGRSRLSAQDHDLPSLGYVLAYGDLSAAMDVELAKHRNDSDKLTILYGAEATSISPETGHASVVFKQDGAEKVLSGQLVVLADGGRSLADIPALKRETKQYGHDALVTKVTAELPHDNIAYERFTPMGPVALLPNGAHEFSLVWTGKVAEINALLAMNDETFLASLHQHFGDRVGRFLAVDKRLTFPLKLSYLDPVTAPHLVVIGNAAQTMHPVAGQGFNVGIRDAWDLARQIATTPIDELGGASMLKVYQQQRKTDTKRGLMFTDFLVNLFSNDIVGLSALRGMGLGMLDVIKPAKNHLISKMSFGSRG